MLCSTVRRREGLPVYALCALLLLFCVLRILFRRILRFIVWIKHRFVPASVLQEFLLSLRLTSLGTNEGILCTSVIRIMALFTSGSAPRTTRASATQSRSQDTNCTAERWGAVSYCSSIGVYSGQSVGLYAMGAYE